MPDKVGVSRHFGGHVPGVSSSSGVARYRGAFAFTAARHVERAQRGYRLPSLSRGSSSGQPLAASLARTRSMSSGAGTASVIWVISTPISTGRFCLGQSAPARPP